MIFKYNPLNKIYNERGGSMRAGSTLSLNVESDGKECALILRNDKSESEVVYPMQRVNGLFSVTVENLKVGLYFYYFVCDGKLFGRDDFLIAKQYKNHETLNKYQFTVYKRSFKTPAWIKGGVIYQIFPDRFNKGKSLTAKEKDVMRVWGDEPYWKPNSDGKILNNDFFDGNFKGIEEKLDYLESLGVTAIYLNPLSKSYSNHHYDTSNYLQFDELLGSDEDFSSLVSKAKEKGIEIIFDGVYNHTGDDSVYFNKYGKYSELGAYQSKNSKYYDWYTFQNFPNLYTSWWGINVLPTINKNSTSFENFVTDEVLKRYFSFGVSGVRLDVVDELPSSFVKKIRKAVKNNNPDAIMIGEVWEDASNKIAYSRRCEYFWGDELDSVMNYPLKNALINFLITGKTNLLTQTVKEQIHNYPSCVLDALMNILGTHDTPRILTVLSGVKIPDEREELSKFSLTELEKEVAVKRLKQALCFIFTIYGVPTIYYGDEIGFEGGKDPFNRKCMDFIGGDKDILTLVKKLSQIRKGSKVFIDGKTEILYCEDGLFAFSRKNAKEEIVTIINAGNYRFTVNGEGYFELISGENKKEYILDKNSYLILKAELR